jgi:AcrR family transcriptional regulator
MASEQLPRGRHRLCREEVERSQRSRLQRALVTLAARHGLAATTVGQLVGEASVSRETFYSLFGSKEECYAAAMVDFDAELHTAAERPFDPGEDPVAALREWLLPVLTVLAADPDMTHCRFFEPAERVATVAGRVTPMRAGLTRVFSAVFDDRDPLGAAAYAAMVRQLIEERLATGAAATLPALADELSTLAGTHRAGLAVS